MSGYNGWANYETWAVTLWIDNDEGTYERRRELAQEAAALDDDDLLIDGTSIRREKADVLAESLRDWVRNDLAPDLGASLWADLLGSALDEVDWQEIAEAWLQEVTP